MGLGDLAGVVGPEATSGMAKEKISMKLVIAYIQPEKLDDVKEALYGAEVYKMSVTNALGCGQQRGTESRIAAW